MFYKSYIAKTAFPEVVAYTGTFSSDGVVVTITSSSEPVRVGQYLYSTLLNEVRKLESITTQEGTVVKGTLKTSFSSNVAEEAIKVSIPIYHNAYIANFGGADGVLNGSVLPNGGTVNIIEKELAFTIDATGTGVSILSVE